MKNFKLFLIAVLTIALFTQTNSFAQVSISNEHQLTSPADFSHLKVAFGNNEDETRANEKTAQMLACPVPVYDFSPAKVVNCTDNCVDMDVRDSISINNPPVIVIGIGDYMQPSCMLRIQKDAFSDTQNTFEAFINGSLFTRIGPANSSPGGGVPTYYYAWNQVGPAGGGSFRYYIYGICPSDQITYKWYDSGNSGSFVWYVWDPATDVVKTSGTATGVAAGVTLATNVTSWAGISTWTCATCPPSSFGQYCANGHARFCPQFAKPGKYGITYTFNKNGTGANACSNSYTDTIEVKGKKATFALPASICASNSTVDLNTYLDALSDKPGTWSSSTSPSSISGSTWSTSGLSGTISLTYTYGLGTSCETAETHTITVNPKPTVTATASPSSVCATGSTNVTLTATGGGTYVWSGGAGSTSSVTVTPGSTTTYTVTVTSSASCTNTGTVTVSINPAPSASLAKVDVKCKGVSTGTATLTVTSGTSPFTYNWSNSATTQNLSGLSNGTYNLTVTDSKGCTATGAVTLTEPATAVSLPTPTSTGTGCGASTGTATANGTGGTGTLTYSWSSGQSTGAITGLAAGTYIVTVKDANNCSATGSAAVAPPPGGPTISITSQKNLTCNGDVNGNAYTSATGGSGTYNYTWSNGQTGSASTSSIINVAAGTYTVTYTDASTACANTSIVTITQPNPYVMNETLTQIVCKGAKNGSITLNPTGNTSPYTFDWSPINKQTQNVSGLNPGSYTVEISDSKGCTKTFSYTITEPASGITLSATATNTSCGASTGTATASATGGTGSLTYLWSNSSTTSSLSNLASGTYDVTVTDASGCSSTSAATVGNANGPTASATKTDASCGSSDGTATASGSGGTGALTYLWSNSATTATISGLAAGTYNVTVTDANGCTSTAAATVGSSNPPTVTATKVDAACGQSDGTATATGSGGTGALTYVWSNFALGNVATGLAAGTYTVVVSDSKGCTSTTTVSITSAGGPTAGLTASKYIGESPLVVDFTNTSTGGTTYTWYFGDGSAPYTGTTPPTHTYTTDGKFYACVVANAGGCKDSTCKDITVSGFKIAVPNIITPNGDKKNDVFVITTKGVTKLDITVWDRWGLLMWEGTGLTPDAVTGFINTWEGKTTSGKECPDGTYYFMLKAYKFDGDIVEDKGFISLVR